MKLTAQEFKNGESLPLKAVSTKLGGEDKSPMLSFEDVPIDAKSLALTCYDPDAPTGSGFWHWIVVNIPFQKSGTLSCQSLPNDASVVLNDANISGYIGAFPPQGDPEHRYIFTLHALSCTNINNAHTLPQAYVRFMIKTNEIASASTFAIFKNESNST